MSGLQVHAAADAVGLGGLESVSRGFGDERYVSVVCRGGPAAKQQVAPAATSPATGLPSGTCPELPHSCQRLVLSRWRT